MDDCSKDKSAELIRTCIRKAEGSQEGTDACGSGKIRLIEKPKNEGAAEARNTGIDAAKRCV